MDDYHDTSAAEALETKIDEVRTNGGPDKPVIVSEIGAGAIHGFHDPLSQAKGSEERQCAIPEEQLETVLAHPEVSGVFIWRFADVHVDGFWVPQRPCTRNNKGVVDAYRRPKMARQAVRKCTSYDPRKLYPREPGCSTTRPGREWIRSARQRQISGLGRKTEPCCLDCT